MSLSSDSTGSILSMYLIAFYRVPHLCGRAEGGGAFAETEVPKTSYKYKRTEHQDIRFKK